jgi:hypothetical protein
MRRMSRHEGDDPGADTAMFRAYVDQQRETVAPEQNRTVIVGLVVAVVVLAVLALVLIAL